MGVRWPAATRTTDEHNDGVASGWREGEVRGQGMQAELAIARFPGNVTFHPAAFVATNVAVVGSARKRDPPGGSHPNATESAGVHVVTSVEPGPLTVKFADGGNLRHAVAVEIHPRSIDQRPPGVFGALVGNARTSTESQCPATQLLLVTRSVTGAFDPMSVAEVHPPAKATTPVRAAMPASVRCSRRVSGILTSVPPRDTPPPGCRAFHSIPACW